MCNEKSFYSLSILRLNVFTILGIIFILNNSNVSVVDYSSLNKITLLNSNKLND